MRRSPEAKPRSYVKSRWSETTARFLSEATMSSQTLTATITTAPDDIRQLVRAELLRLAHREEQAAFLEAAKVPYWATIPDSVLGHRRGAAALRSAAEELEAA